MDSATAVTTQARASMLTCVDEADELIRRRWIDNENKEVDRHGRLHMNIPEYHDEGRLPTGNGKILGPMAQIFASPFLGTFTRRGQILEQGRPGAFVAQVFVEPDRAGQVIPHAYQKLHLQFGKNCIWLYAPPETNGFRVFVSHPADPKDACDRTFTITDSLEVMQHRLVGSIDNNGRPVYNTPSSLYPPVARFDVDQGNQPVLAFKCIAAFCEAGPYGFTRRSSHRSSSTAPLPAQERYKDDPVRHVKGWHDEQELAERDDFGIWRATGVWATMEPHRTVTRHDAPAFDDTFIGVATIHIHGTLLPTSKYYRWGLRQGANYLRLKRETATDKWIVGIAYSQNGPIEKTWTNTLRMIHHDAAVPATARFRWTLADDGAWFPCGTACCRSDGT